MFCMSDVFLFFFFSIQPVKILYWEHSHCVLPPLEPSSLKVQGQATGGNKFYSHEIEVSLEFT